MRRPCHAGHRNGGAGSIMKVPSSAAAFGLAAGVLLGGSVAARAQGNPSADQIIRSLQPGGGMLGTTRGIRPVAPALEPPGNVTPAALPRTGPSPGPGPHAGATAQRMPVGAAMPSVNLTVHFPTNSAELTPAATRVLDELGRALSSQALASFRFRIEGHTDTVGAPDANRMLSERRAATVVQYLVEKFNVDRVRLEPVGMGQDGLLVQTPPQSAEPRNRRVQVVNLGA